MVAWQVKKIKPITKPSWYTFTWYVKDSRTDSDNTASACKYVFDGLQEAGKLPNDSLKWVLAIDHRFVIGKEEKVIVEVIDYED